ncbi:MAG: hypothetical protein OES26_26615 [Gammaproteobacteria bacterium]|nr:hypothetical protein [Gammaproteobacteria bacterium]
MKNMIYAIAAAFILVSLNNAFAEPIAKLAPLNSFGKQAFAAEGKTEEDARNDIPSREMIGLPAFPDSYFAGAGGDGDSIDTLMLMSKADPNEVIAWYQKKLGGGWQNMPELATKQLGEIAVFVKTDKKNISAMDSLKYQQIRISKVEKPEDTGFAAMMFDVSDIRCMINMTIKPFM